MRLGQVADALGINEKTADNAIRTLGLPRPLDLDTVRALGLALRAKYRYGVPLKRAYSVVRDAMNRPELRKKDAMVREVFTYLPEVRRRIRMTIKHHKPLPRGPGWRDPFHPEVPARDRRHPAVRRAIQWGLDLSLNFAVLHEDRGKLLQNFSATREALAVFWKAARGKGVSVSLAAMWEQLAQNAVRFVVVGGVAAVAQGSARDTRDLDICYDTHPDNVATLVRLLNSWHARLRVPCGLGESLPFVIDPRTFRDSPVLTLETDLGWIDLMDRVTGVGDYAAVQARSEQVALGPVDLWVLTLDALITSKRAVGRRQDVEHLIELEAIRALQRESKKTPRKRRRPRR